MSWFLYLLLIISPCVSALDKTTSCETPLANATFQSCLRSKRGTANAAFALISLTADLLGSLFSSTFLAQFPIYQFTIFPTFPGTADEFPHFLSHHHEGHGHHGSLYNNPFGSLANYHDVGEFHEVHQRNYDSNNKKMMEIKKQQQMEMKKHR